MRVLSREELGFFEENGYVIVREVLPPENCEAVVDAIFCFLGMDRNDPEDWYHEPHRPGGMVEIYQHQALWNNRQHPLVHQAFADIWGTEKLWVSMDRAGFKPPRHPAHPEYDHKGFIHWDADTSRLPLTFGVQGVVCLTDTAEKQGGFQCVPGMHRRLEEWVKTQPPDRNPRAPDLAGLTVKQVPGRQGDLIIWNRGLPHGNGHNVSNLPRFSQYITMSPANESDESARRERIRIWKERVQPGNFPGDPRGWEKEHNPPASLTPLGRKLLGADPWD